MKYGNLVRYAVQSNLAASYQKTLLEFLLSNRELEKSTIKLKTAKDEKVQLLQQIQELKNTIAQQQKLLEEIQKQDSRENKPNHLKNLVLLYLGKSYEKRTLLQLCEKF
jgi:hypothetical protein